MMLSSADHPDESDPRPMTPPPGLPGPTRDPEVFPSPPDPIPTPDATPIESPVDPIEVLRAEHRLIDRVLTAFVAWADTVRSLGASERAELERFTRFFDRFLDRCHHAKEEDILFRALEAADPRSGALVHVSFVEQEEQRRFLEPLQELACGPRSVQWGVRDMLSNGVARFAASVRSHIAAEECVLFPVARARIPGDAMARAGEAFTAFEAATMFTPELVVSPHAARDRGCLGAYAGPSQSRPVPRPRVRRSVGSRARHRNAVGTG